MIVTLLTDYGRDDDFVGVCHGVIARIAPDARDHRRHPRHPAPRRAPRGARAAQRAALHAAGRAHRGGRPAGGHRAARAGAPLRRRPRARGARQRPAVAGLGALRAAWTRRWTCRARRTGSSPCRPPSTAATCSRRWPPHLAAGAELADAGDPLDPAELLRLELPEPRVEGDALLAHVLVVDRFGNVSLDADATRTWRARASAGRAGGVEARGERYLAHFAQSFADVRAGRAAALRGRLPHARDRRQPRRRGRHHEAGARLRGAARSRGDRLTARAPPRSRTRPTRGRVSWPPRARRTARSSPRPSRPPAAAARDAAGPRRPGARC